MGTDTLEELEKKRDRARAKALDDPRQAEVRALTEDIVKLKQRGRPATAAQTKRAELQALINAEADKLSEKVRQARAAARAAVRDDMAATAETLSDEELAERLRSIDVARRALKAEQRGLLKVQARRDHIRRMKEIAAKLSPDERATLAAELGA